MLGKQLRRHDFPFFNAFILAHLTLSRRWYICFLQILPWCIIHNSCSILWEGEKGCVLQSGGYTSTLSPLCRLRPTTTSQVESGHTPAQTSLALARSSVDALLSNESHITYYAPRWSMVALGILQFYSRHLYYLWLPYNVKCFWHIHWFVFMYDRWNISLVPIDCYEVSFEVTPSVFRYAAVFQSPKSPSFSVVECRLCCVCITQSHGV